MTQTDAKEGKNEGRALIGRREGLDAVAMGLLAAQNLCTNGGDRAPLAFVAT